MNEGKRPAAALAIGVAIGWLVVAFFSARELSATNGSLRMLRMMMPDSPELQMNPWVEGAKGATLVALTFIVGLPLALRLRSRGWGGIVIVGLAAVAVRWLAKGAVYGYWDFYHVFPTAAIVAALAAGDWLARGKSLQTRQIYCLAAAVSAFFL